MSSNPSSGRAALAETHRLVVKLGTHVVIRDDGDVATERVTNLVEGLARQRRAGRDVVLVSSGAVGMGMRLLGLRQRPRSLGLRQACAAVGQGHLMGLYTKAFAEFGVVAAQVLLTHEDLADRDRALCLRTTLMRLLELGTIPVLNENDSVSVRELVEHRRREGEETSQPVFGDNDGLSAHVAVALDADLLVMLSNVDGLFTANPALDPNAQRVAELSSVDEQALARATGASSGGTGGMGSKLEAARLATAEGTAVVIANGGMPDVLGQDLGRRRCGHADSAGGVATRPLAPHSGFGSQAGCVSNSGQVVDQRARPVEDDVADHPQIVAAFPAPATESNFSFTRAPARADWRDAGEPLKPHSRNPRLCLGSGGAGCSLKVADWFATRNLQPSTCNRASDAGKRNFSGWQCETSRCSRSVAPPRVSMLIAFHKPDGVLSQFTSDGSPNRTLAAFGFPAGVYPIGRLDAIRKACWC